MLERTTWTGPMEEPVENVPRNRKRNGGPVVGASRLVLESVIREKGKKSMAVCLCACGNKKTTYLAHFNSGAVKSCGCLKKETAFLLGRCNEKHGHSSPEKRSPEYRSWEAMKSRCNNKNDPSYALYGGRGICVDGGWDCDFTMFLADMGARPRGTSIDRIDVDGNYTKENCRWATPKTKQRNKTSNRIVEFDGRAVTLAELCETTGVPYQRLHERIVRRGWSVLDAVSKPLRGHW